MTRARPPLFGPRPVLEVTLTVYDNNTVGYQFTGLHGTYTPEDIWYLLRWVAGNVAAEHQQNLTHRRAALAEVPGVAP